MRGNLTEAGPRGLVPRVKSHKRLRFSLALLGIAALGFGARPAMAREHSDRVVAEQLVMELSQLSEEDRPAVSGPMAQAEKALARAADARGGGDDRAGELLEGLAREWAEMAQNTWRAAEAEAAANARKAKAAKVATRADRARALLEEAIIRRGRREAKLRQMNEEQTAPAEAAKGQGR